MLWEPKYINCSTVDLNLDGVLDCLIIDIYGQLSCLKTSGDWLWRPKEKKPAELEEMPGSFPLVLPDLNGDKINELLHIGKNSFSLLSGKNGRIIGHSIEVSECKLINDLELAELYTIRYKCHGVASTFSKSIGLSDLYTALTGKLIDVGHLNSTISLTQPKMAAQNLTSLTMVLHNFSLTVENIGICPFNCSSTIALHQNTSDGEKLVYNFTARNMKCSAPITFEFHNKFSKNGFVFKYVQWSTDELNTTTAEGGIQIRVLKETVAIVMFGENGGDLKIENTSQSHVMQFCRRKGKNQQQLRCQPNVASNLMSITDMDEDGSQELITFYTTFDSRTKDRGPGQEHLLKTYVHLLDIESEIPKLYGTDRRK